MGTIIEASTEIMRPLDVVLVREDFRKFLEIYDKGLFHTLLPGIAYELDQEKYGVFDGNHRAMICAVTSSDYRIYLPENEEDFISSHDFPGVPSEFIDYANLVIKKAPERLSNALVSVEKKGIRSFQDLMDEYQIQTLDDIRMFAVGSITHKWARSHKSNCY